MSTAILVSLRARPPLHPDDANTPRLFVITSGDASPYAPPPELALERVCRLLYDEYLAEWNEHPPLGDAENGPSPDDIPTDPMSVETLKDLYVVTWTRVSVETV